MQFREGKLYAIGDKGKLYIYRDLTIYQEREYGETAVHFYFSPIDAPMTRHLFTASCIGYTQIASVDPEGLPDELAEMALAALEVNVESD